MELFVLTDIASNWNVFLHTITLHFKHNTLNPSTEPSSSYISTIAEHPTVTINAMIPPIIRTIVKDFFGERPDESNISIFLNAYHLQLLPTTQPTSPQNAMLRRWPMSLKTHIHLRKLAFNKGLTLNTYLPYIPLPPIPSSSVFLQPRSVTTYQSVKSDMLTIQRLSDYYDEAHLIAPVAPRSIMSKVGYVLDYISSIDAELPIHGQDDI